MVRFCGNPYTGGVPHGLAWYSSALRIQLIAVFNQGFTEKLSYGEQRLHFISILLVIIAVALAMAPAALHRHVDPFSVSDRFIRLASRLLLQSMVSLAISLSLDVYLISRIVLNSVEWGLFVSGMVFALFLSLWFGLPIRERRRGSQ